MGQRILLLLAALVITALVTGCSQDSSGSAERIQLPFESIMADLDLTIPDGLTAKPTEDGAWPPHMLFEKPVHPLGSVRSLTIEGHDMILTDTLLVDGMLATRDFGSFEFIMLGPSDVEVHATQSQIDQITKWIGAGSKE